VKTYGEWRRNSSTHSLPRNQMGLGCFATWPLYLNGKNPRYPLDRRLSGPQSRSERDGEERRPFRESNPSRPARSLDTTGRTIVPTHTHTRVNNTCFHKYAPQLKYGCLTMAWYHNAPEFRAKYFSRLLVVA
jgi:hypothetical protein